MSYMDCPIKRESYGPCRYCKGKYFLVSGRTLSINEEEGLAFVCSKLDNHLEKPDGGIS